jgi:hypothetical protein
VFIVRVVLRGSIADGFFVYAEGYNRSALLLAPELSLDGPPASRCLSFWYYAFGNQAANPNFRVYVGREQVYSRPEWSRRRLESGIWTRGAVHVSPRAAPLQVVFSVEFGEVFGGLALDDISVINGPCDSRMSELFASCFFVGRIFICV